MQKKGGHPKSGKNSTNSDLAQTFSQNSILRKKKGGEHLKSGKNSNNSDLAETFRITSGLRKNGIGDKKI